MTAGLTPNQAFQLDTKIDDGLPNTGTVQAGGAGKASALTAVVSTIYSGASGGDATGGLLAGDCIDTTLNIYATAMTTSKDTNGCVLRVRTNF